MSSIEITKFLWKESENIKGHISHDEYIKHPATAFLAYANRAKESIEFCKQNFPKHSGNNNLTTDSIINVQLLMNSVLASLLGHFETFEKHLFAGTFERTVYLNNFNSHHFFKTLDIKDDIPVSKLQMLGNRKGDTFVGLILANSLNEWQNPTTVIKYFNAFNLQPPRSFFSNENKVNLEILWQLRHSIVHTGGTLTKSDALKVKELKNTSGKNIVFSTKFIYELTKWFHSLVFQSVSNLKTSFENGLDTSIKPTEKAEIMKFFEVKSSVTKWLV